MSLLIANIPEITSIFLWVGCWFLGGFLLTINSLRIQRNDATIIGFGIGLILQAWIANFTGRFFPPLIAFWMSAIILLLLGLVLTLAVNGWKNAINNFYFYPKYWIAFVVIVLIFYKIGQGLAIYDDYQNLPITSYIASGSIPPQFVLNPDISFDYHYLMLIISAQWMVIADLFPWTALDICRAITLAIALIYTVILTKKLTRSAVAGWLSLPFVAFAGGTRWLMLYLPSRVLDFISKSVTMIGSGKSTAETLAQAMQSNWVIDGVGPIQFPFAFGNSIHGIPIMGHGGVGLLILALPLIILLTFGQWKNNAGKVLFAALLCAMALVDEVWYGFFMASCGLVLVYLILRKKLFYGTPAWKILIFLFIPIGLISLVQGGVLSGITKNIFLSTVGSQEVEITKSYFTASFPIRWPPAVISAHLGKLFLTNPGQLLAAIFEVGPIVFAFPLLIFWGKKAYRYQRWLYFIIAVGASISLLTIFVEYEGSAGIAASVRLPAYCYGMCRIFAVSLFWYWLQNKNTAIKMGMITLGFLSMVGGMFYFGIESISGQKPILSTFIEPMDATMENNYWDELPRDTMVFDLVPSRSATIFARPSRSQNSWYQNSEEFIKLGEDLDPYQLNNAGYGFSYWSENTWNTLTETEKEAFSDPCVVLIEEITLWDNDFRKLLDLSACQNRN